MEFEAHKQEWEKNNVGLMFTRRQLDQEFRETQHKLEKTQEEKEARETLKVLKQNFVVVEGMFNQMVEEIKNAALCHEEVLTTTLVRHKEEMELVMECLRKFK